MNKENYALILVDEIIYSCNESTQNYFTKSWMYYISVCTEYAFQQAYFLKVINVLSKLLTVEAVDGKITLSSSFNQIFHLGHVRTSRLQNKLTLSTVLNCPWPICLESFAATEFGKIFSSRQPRQGCESSPKFQGLTVDLDGVNPWNFEGLSHPWPCCMFEKILMSPWPNWKN